MDESIQNIFTGFSGQEEDIIPLLHRVQENYNYLPASAMQAIARFTRVPESQIFDVATFYTEFKLAPMGKKHIQICRGTACRMQGSVRYVDVLEQHLGTKAGEHAPNAQYSLEVVECLGLCDQAPAALVNGLPVTINPDMPPETWLETAPEVPLGTVEGDPRWLTARIGSLAPDDVPAFENTGGFSGLRAALVRTPQEVIAEVERSGLSGRGGAAFPTGLKWKFTAGAKGEPKYVVCNADESEPGTFKDRVLIEGDPLSVIEGMLIAGYAIGAAQGYVYIRSEYHRPSAILQRAIDAAYAAGYLGQDILGSGFSFDLEIRTGAGAYICGEETALFESIEGRRGKPRYKPPFPTTNGLFDKPTVINNVETLCTASWILAHGAQAYRNRGTSDSPGTKLFCLSGDVNRPGVYEAPFGTPMNDLIEMAGGPKGAVQAVLVGGAAGSFASPDQLETPMSFEALKDAGLSLGSGVLMVVGQERDMREVLLSLALFFAHESCGKCYPCRLGTGYQLEIVKKIVAGTVTKHDLERLQTIGKTMTTASFCGLGQTAATAILSAIDKGWID